jgi:uncharacterized protein (DUF934 family)
MRPEIQDVLRESSGSGKAEVMILEGKLTARRFPHSDTPRAGTVIPWTTWLEAHGRGDDLAEVGVLFPNDKDIALLTPHLYALPVVALNFPRFQDGRAYSQARRLTHLLGYKGIVLAVGDVLRDQVLYMSRVGFNAFHLRADQDPVATLRAFTLYSAFYQYGAR